MIEIDNNNDTININDVSMKSVELTGANRDRDRSDLIDILKSSFSDKFIEKKITEMSDEINIIHMFFIQYKNENIGCVQFKGKLSISTLCVIPKYRNKGIASGIMNHLIYHYKKIHIKKKDITDGSIKLFNKFSDSIIIDD